MEPIRSSWILFSVFCLVVPQVAFAAEKVAESAYRGWFIFALLVLGTWLLVKLWARRRNAVPARGKEAAFAILQDQAVDPRSRLLAVKFQGEVCLVGLSTNGFVVLKSKPSSHPALNMEPRLSASGVFSLDPLVPGEE